MIPIAGMITRAGVSANRNGKPMSPSLNTGQQLAEQAVFQFLLSQDKFFRLAGGAGVGKTFMMKHIMDNVLKEYEHGMQLLGMKPIITTAQLTATTNKAAEVLEGSTGYPTTTLHSYLGLKVRNSFSTGTTFLEKTASFNVKSRVLLFVDEASMVDTPLLEFLQEAMDDSCKIIFVGDHYQMAPITEPISPVYQNLDVNFHELTEPVRNSGQPALMALCAQLRQTVHDGIFRYIDEVPGVIDYIDDAKLQHILDTEFVNEHVDSRILCFTNHRVGMYNEYIREIRGYPAEFTAGEVLINNTNVMLGKFTMKVEQQFEVVSVNTPVHPVEIDEDNPKITMDCYSLTLETTNGNQITVLVPASATQKKELMNYYKGQKEWRMFYALQQQYPDLRQKDASTVWKAQGSTYDSVIVDLTNISQCRDNDQVARMLYVSGSRPRNRIYLYGQLARRFYP